MRVPNKVGAALALALAASGAPLLPLAPAQAAPAPAEVSVVHGIPNTPVDVYVDGKLTLPDFTFGKVAGPLAFPPAPTALPCGPTRRPPASTPILYRRVSVSAGEDASIVANLTASGSPTLSVFANPTTSVPVGDAQVIVRHLAEAPGRRRLRRDLQGHHRPHQPQPSGPGNPGRQGLGERGRDRHHHTVIGPATFHFLAGRTTVIYAIGSAAGKTLTVAVQKYHVPQAAAPAEVTVVHGIPNTPVDVYVNGKLTLPDFTFGKVARPTGPARRHVRHCRTASGGSAFVGAHPVPERHRHLGRGGQHRGQPDRFGLTDPVGLRRPDRAGRHGRCPGHRPPPG